MRPKGSLVPTSAVPSTVYTESSLARGDLPLTSNPKPSRVKVIPFDALSFPSPLLDSGITGEKKIISR